ncbi:MAG TPA: hypothetical protein PKG95_15950 [Anaerolineaceae bacterium]|nr:hypothetical protein [Anaerolineaceae bacterium]
MLDQILQELTHLPVFILNGFLWLIYAAADHLPALVSLGCGLATIVGLDVVVQRSVTARPLRDGRGETTTSPRTAQIVTGLVLLLWLMAQHNLGAPVPWIGMAMWMAGILSVLLLPSERFNQLWAYKSGIAIYALAVLAGRIYMSASTTISAEQWAALLGSSQTASSVLIQARSNVNTIILWGLWMVVPLGYFSLLVQKIFMHPLSLTNPLTSVEQMLSNLRDRGGR